MDHCISNLDAHGLVKRLGAALVRAVASQPISDYLPALEKIVAESQATIQDALGKPGATVHDAVEALIQEKEVAFTTARGGSQLSDEGGEMLPRGDAIEAALRSPAFKRIANLVNYTTRHTTHSEPHTHIPRG